MGGCGCVVEGGIGEGEGWLMGVSEWVWWWLSVFCLLGVFFVVLFYERETG